MQGGMIGGEATECRGVLRKPIRALITSGPRFELTIAMSGRNR